MEFLGVIHLMVVRSWAICLSAFGDIFNACFQIADVYFSNASLRFDRRVKARMGQPAPAVSTQVVHDRTSN